MRKLMTAFVFFCLAIALLLSAHAIALIVNGNAG